MTQTKSSEFFDQLRDLLNQPFVTDDTPDETMFGPDADATQEEIEQIIKESNELDS